MTTANADDPTALYRFFDTEGKLLYAGITGDPAKRWPGHKGKLWWPEIASMTIEWFDTRAEAAALERRAIRNEAPQHNIIHMLRAPAPPAPLPAYRRLADDLRTAITTGHYQPGDTLPKLSDLMAQYDISKTTVAEAIALLEAEGLVEAVRRRGTIVRARPTPRRLTRARHVYRDDRGYYFDPTAQPWVALETPTVSWGRAPADVAHLLGVDTGEDALIRDRIMGDPDTRRPMQLATSYLPAAIARGTRLAEADTGPGGIYDLLEGMGHRPLAWGETVGARMPTPAEAARLVLAKGVPLLRIVRTATGPDGTVLEVNDTRMSAEEFEIGYSISRHPSAELG